MATFEICAKKILNEEPVRRNGLHRILKTLNSEAVAGCARRRHIAARRRFFVIIALPIFFANSVSCNAGGATVHARGQRAAARNTTARSSKPLRRFYEYARCLRMGRREIRHTAL
jgi:site-specific recombinase XerD